MIPRTFGRRIAGAASVAVLFAAVTAFAQGEPEMAPMQTTNDPMVPADEATHIALLSGTNAVPPIEVNGTGTAWILYDEEAGTLTWTVEYEGLTGPATAAHFHGPAGPDENAGVVLGIVTANGGLESPIQGTAEITDEQAEVLLGGMWYVNIHTEANPGGEIRGQVEAVEEETAAAAEPAPGPASTQEAAEEVTGADLWRQAGCFNCHGNLADGAGDPAYPVGPNLRRSALDLEMLIQTIACGRPSTSMPMFLEGAYTETSCYGMPAGAVPDGVDVGGNFSASEIALLADFLVEHVLGQTRVTRENCGAFFNGNVDAPLCRQY